MAHAVLVTGCLGGIGQALTKAFYDAGWFVVGVDIAPPSDDTLRSGPRLTANIEELACSPETMSAFGVEVRRLVGNNTLKAVINNAAVQHLGGLDKIAHDKIISTLNTNVLAPIMLIREFLPELRENQGTVINIGSVHAQATKPGFFAYAASKAALHGLTRSLAVDLGPDVRVLALAPAATATPMLKDGFSDNQPAYAALKDVHPLQRIAEPSEIAELALFLTSDTAAFLTGETLYADGGILSRLHDPV